ncbi:MAG: hypothetical protein Q8M39_02870 [Sulfuricurvum sp.]|nr:hypothetical protein [Sulfuricurvum sp.]
MEQIEQIEHAVLEYWWDNKEVENAKTLALAQINEALERLNDECDVCDYSDHL